MHKRVSVLLLICIALLAILVACGGTKGSSDDESDVFVYGLMTDMRDGQTYRTVSIGSQTWMAENMNYDVQNSFCYEDNPNNCIKYGRIYIGELSIDACPDGWHLPTLTEWDTLISAVGGRSIAGKVLKSTDGWVYGKNGTDDYGFSALPAGARIRKSEFYAENSYYSKDGYDAFFLSASEKDSMKVYIVSLHYYSDSVDFSYVAKEHGFSVRCVFGDAPDNSKTPKGRFFDTRDFQTYKTVTIGSQIWMAENLNYETENSSCYDSIPRNCTKYGRLYSWSAAMDACPIGWHLPTETEWVTLIETIGDPQKSDKKLKSSIGWDVGWVSDIHRNGTDDYGFSALPINSRANFWSSTEKEKNAFMYDIDRTFEYGIKRPVNEHSYRDKNNQYSVRCVKNEVAASPSYILNASTKSSSSTVQVKNNRSSSSVFVLRKKENNFFQMMNLSSSSARSRNFVRPSTVVQGTLKDSRDGQIYKTVKIGSQIWMAENLNYEMANSSCFSKSVCKNSQTGRFYTWDAAMNACPAGWHLPTQAEWNTLFVAVGGMEVAGQKLKKTAKFGTYRYIEYCDTDDYGFTALSVGAECGIGKYLDYFDDGNAFFWSSTEDDENHVSRVNLRRGVASAQHGYSDKKYRYSVRCVQDRRENVTPSSSHSVIPDPVPGSDSNNITLSLPSSSSWSNAIGSITDPRDGQIYRTVKIGEQIWMAENLNYESEFSYCRGDSLSNCDKYGRLYKWYSAMDACPAGWRLPTREDWDTLVSTVGNKLAGKNLKSTMGWPDNHSGVDAYGFSVIPLKNGKSSFWTSTESYFLDIVSALSMNFYDWSDEASNIEDMKLNNNSIRCIKGGDRREGKDESGENNAVIPDPVPGSDSILTDPRDGQIYRTVKIGEQIWMAENLNYKTDSSYCSYDDLVYCSKHGRHYTWNVALNACPTGWHLPTWEEWEKLIDTVGGEYSARRLMAKGWKWNGFFSVAVGTDEYGFSVFPNIESARANFWSSSDRNSRFACAMYVDCIEGSAPLHDWCFRQRAFMDDEYKDERLSIRCIKGELPKSNSSETSSFKRESCYFGSKSSFDYENE